MAAWNGRPVLALASLAQVPLVPPSPGKAGARAGFLAAFDNSGHSEADEINFAYAKHAASQHGDYDYSRQWLAGLAAGKALLRALTITDAGPFPAEDQPLAARGHGHQLLGDADEDFEFYPMSDHVLAEGLLAEHGQEWPR